MLTDGVPYKWTYLLTYLGLGLVSFYAFAANNRRPLSVKTYSA